MTDNGPDQPQTQGAEGQAGDPTPPPEPRPGENRSGQTQNAAGDQPNSKRRLPRWLSGFRDWVWHRLKRMELTDFLIVILTGVIAYSTWSSDHTFQRQLAEMQATSRQTDRAIEASLINGGTMAYQVALTGRALSLAQGQLAIARDTERRQLKAYVGIGFGAGFESFRNPTQQFLVNFTLLNHGLTPASELRVFGSIDIAPWPLPKNYTFIPAEARPQTAVLFPSDAPRAGAQANRKFTPVEWSEITNMGSRKRVYFYGSILYKDISGIQQTLDFCYLMNPGSITEGPRGPGFEWAPVEGRNSLKSGD